MFSLRLQSTRNEKKKKTPCKVAGLGAAEEGREGLLLTCSEAALSYGARRSLQTDGRELQSAGSPWDML